MTMPSSLKLPVRSASLLCLGIAVGACETTVNTELADDDLQGMEANSVIYGMTSYLTTAGVRQGMVQADTAYMYADSSVARLLNMEIIFYDEEGRETATVVGRNGRWSQLTDEMVARGAVVLRIHSDGSVVESEEIHYDPALEKVWSDSTTVRTLADGSVTSGSSFESDMTFEHFVIRNPRGGTPPGR